MKSMLEERMDQTRRKTDYEFLQNTAIEYYVGILSRPQGAGLLVVKLKIMKLLMACCCDASRGVCYKIVLTKAGKKS